MRSSLIVQKNDEIQEIMNSPKFKAFEEERERLKKMRKGTQSPQNIQDAATKFPDIKGLKQFLSNSLANSIVR